MPAWAPTPSTAAEDTGSALDALRRNAQRSPRRVALRRMHFNRWLPVTYEDFNDQVRQVAKGLAACGVQPGDRIAVLSERGFHCAVADFAIWYAGAVPVAIWEHSSAEELEWALSETGAVGMFLAPGRQELFDLVAEQVPHVSRTWTLTSQSLDALAESGEFVGDDDLEARSRCSHGHGLAAIHFTSGTTGRPKACMVTHRNLLAASHGLVHACAARFTPQHSTLLVLAHAQLLSRVLQHACLATGVELGHAEGPGRLTDDLATFRPTFLLATGSQLDAITGQARRTAAAGGSTRVFDAALATAEAYSRALEGRGPSRSLRARHATFDQLVYRNVRGLLGGRAEQVIVVGPPSGSHARHLLRSCGVEVLPSYGMTEAGGFCAITGPAAATNVCDGSTPGLEVRIAVDGEVLLRGASVFPGYFNDAGATRDVLPGDRWLHTGDLGRLDRDGCLRIFGRACDLLRRPTGAPVMPAAVEGRLCAHPAIASCLVAGQDRLVALVTVDSNWLADWLRTTGRPADTPPSSVVADPALLAGIRAYIERVNRSVPTAERIHDFAVLPVQWTQATGHVGPSGELRRKLVGKEFATEIEALLG